MRGEPIPPAHEAAISAAYLAGATAQEAAAQFGYAKKTTLRTLKRHGIAARPNLIGVPQVMVEQEEAMVAAYPGGATAQEAAAQFGYDPGTCLNVLKKRGITRRTNTEAQQIPQARQEAIVAAYLAGATLVEAAALFGYSERACRNALDRRGIPHRNVAKVNRKYEVDEAFFDTIDSEEKAYILRFITADGAIIRNYIQIVLQEVDAALLHKITAAMNSTHPVKYLRDVQNEKYFYYCLWRKQNRSLNGELTVW